MPKSDETEALLESIDKKLGLLITLNAVSLAASKDLDNPTKIRLLTLAGLTSSDIGKMIGMHADWVRHVRSGADQKRGKTFGKGGEEDAKR